MIKKFSGRYHLCTGCGQTFHTSYNQSHVNCVDANESEVKAEVKETKKKK